MASSKVESNFTPWLWVATTPTDGLLGTVLLDAFSRLVLLLLIFAAEVERFGVELVTFDEVLDLDNGAGPSTEPRRAVIVAVKPRIY